VDKTRVRVGDRVVVCGGGPIGQLVIQLLARFGATSLTIIEPIEARRKLACRFGAVYAIDPITQDVISEAKRITRGQGFDVVIDASGSTRAVRGLLDIAAKGATVVYGAMYPQDFEMPLNLGRYMYSNELTITGVFISPYAFPRAVQMLSYLRLDELTQAVFPLDQATEAFAAHVSGLHPKVVIRCNEIEDTAL
jgi:(R,R)-butanediol dehydrogenase/meso-butanediol dehydrogenase/diacetyl reductase/L-iditol 2-dehydrogenase